jgi:hypothetical protein
MSPISIIPSLFESLQYINKQHIKILIPGIQDQDDNIRSL